MDKVVLSPEKKQYQEIGEDLRSQIIQGMYPIGSRLLPERNIAETYGVSRTIVREALLMLESNIAAFAAKMATKADIDNLKRILEQEQRAIAVNDTSQDNNKMFHLVLAGASQNQMLLSTVESIWRHHDSSPLWQHLENVKNSLLELSDSDASDFDGYLFESVPIFQGKLV